MSIYRKWVDEQGHTHYLKIKGNLMREIIDSSDEYNKCMQAVVPVRNIMSAEMFKKHKEVSSAEEYKKALNKLRTLTKFCSC